jgi:hypothetical protein
MMRIAPYESRLGITGTIARELCDAGGRSPLAAEWIKAMAEAVRQHDVVLVKLGALRLDGEASGSVAEAIVHALREELILQGAPSRLVAEFDPVDDTMVEDGMLTRDRVPHNDGQHSTFLTPSRLDVPSFDWRHRTFGGDRGGARSDNHKVFSAIQIMDPGEALSITTFYDCFAMVRAAYQFRAKHSESEVPAAVVQSWLANNIEQAQARQPEHGSPYISLAGLLGGPLDLACEAVCFCTMEAEVEPDLLVEHPQLDRLRSSCPCGTCERDTERIYCQMMHSSLGIDMPQFRKEYEVWMSSERYDLIFWNNIAQLHGAVMGSSSRLLRAMYLSLESGDDQEYERWLSGLWDRKLACHELREYIG